MAKTAAAATRGNTYQLTATGTKHLQDVSGQGAIIRDALKGRTLTSAEIGDRVGKSLKTPNPSKTIAFYLCTWKADGFVKFGPKRKS